MSNINKPHRTKKNIYPLSQKTVLYNHRKNIKPIPEEGKLYHVFDDGKITFSRIYTVKVLEVLGQMAFKRKYPELFAQYLIRSKESYWLFSRSTDKFVVTTGENDDEGPSVFVRTKQGGWFSIGNLFNSGSLDITGNNFKWLVNNINLFSYTDEEKKELIKKYTL